MPPVQTGIPPATAIVSICAISDAPFVSSALTAKASPEVRITTRAETAKARMARL